MTKPVHKSDLQSALQGVLNGPVKLAPTASEPDFDETETPAESTLDCTVLLVEDNIVNQQVAQGMLEAMGCTVATALNGEEGLAAVEAMEFDLVFMDCQMPVMDGFAATQAIREREADDRRRVPGQGRLRIVALTAHARQADREDCIAAGMDDYVSKPFTKDDLRVMLEKWAVSNSDRAVRAAKSGPPPGLATLDAAVLRNLNELQHQGGSADLVARVVDAFLKSSSELIESMQTASTDGSPEAVASAAHTLKSSSAQVGAHRLSALCKQVEQLGREEAVDAIPALLEDIAGELESVHERLATERAILESG